MPHNSCFYRHCPTFTYIENFMHKHFVRWTATISYTPSMYTIHNVTESTKCIGVVGFLLFRYRKNSESKPGVTVFDNIITTLVPKNIYGSEHSDSQIV